LVTGRRFHDSHFAVITDLLILRWLLYYFDSFSLALLIFGFIAIIIAYYIAAAL